MSTLNIPLFYRRLKRHLSPNLALWLTHSGSNYSYVEQISMVPRMFEPLRFDCTITPQRTNSCPIHSFIPFSVFLHFCFCSLLTWKHREGTKKVFTMLCFGCFFSLIFSGSIMWKIIGK